MKKPMRKMLRRTGWAMMAAGSLAATSPLFAQTPIMAPLPDTQLSQPVAIVAPPAMDADHGRLEEIKVELAFLANPGTFPYQLRAQAQGTTLEIHGYVLNDGVRENALKVARESTKLSVVDNLKIHPTLAVRSDTAPAEELRTSAVAQLTEAFGEQVSLIDIKANPAGQLTLTGNILSYEEKLSISRRLHRLKGCTSIVNQLEVPTVQRNGKLCLILSTDGKRVVPIETRQPNTAPKVSKPQAAAILPPVPATSNIAATHPAAPASSRAVVISTDKPIAAPNPAAPVVTNSPAVQSTPSVVIAQAPATGGNRPTAPTSAPVPVVVTAAPRSVEKPVEQVVQPRAVKGLGSAPAKLQEKVADPNPQPAPASSSTAVNEIKKDAVPAGQASQTPPAARTPAVTQTVAAVSSTPTPHVVHPETPAAHQEKAADPKPQQVAPTSPVNNGVKKLGTASVQATQTPIIIRTSATNQAGAATSTTPTPHVVHPEASNTNPEKIAAPKPQPTAVTAAVSNGTKKENVASTPATQTTPVAHSSTPSQTGTAAPATSTPHVVQSELPTVKPVSTEVKNMPKPLPPVTETKPNTPTQAATASPGSGTTVSSKATTVSNTAPPIKTVATAPASNVSAPAGTGTTTPAPSMIPAHTKPDTAGPVVFNINSASNKAVAPTPVANTSSPPSKPIIISGTGTGSGLLPKTDSPSATSAAAKPVPTSASQALSIAPTGPARPAPAGAAVARFNPADLPIGAHGYTDGSAQEAPVIIGPSTAANFAEPSLDPVKRVVASLPAHATATTELAAVPLVDTKPATAAWTPVTLDKEKTSAVQPAPVAVGPVAAQPSWAPTGQSANSPAVQTTAVNTGAKQTEQATKSVTPQVEPKPPVVQSVAGNTGGAKPTATSQNTPAKTDTKPSTNTSVESKIPVVQTAAGSTGVAKPAATSQNTPAKPDTKPATNLSTAKSTPAARPTSPSALVLVSANEGGAASGSSGKPDKNPAADNSVKEPGLFTAFPDSTLTTPPSAQPSLKPSTMTHTDTSLKPVQSSGLPAEAVQWGSAPARMPIGQSLASPGELRPLTIPASVTPDKKPTVLESEKKDVAHRAGEAYETTGTMSFSFVNPAPKAGQPNAVTASQSVAPAARQEIRRDPAAAGSPAALGTVAPVKQTGWTEGAGQPNVSIKPIAYDPASQAALKRRVELLCANSAKSVDVKIQPDGKVTLFITVPNADMIEPLSRKLFEMPEMLMHPIHPEFVVNP